MSETDTTQPEYITLREAARRSGWTKHWIMELAKKNRIRTTTIPPYGLRAYCVEDVDKIAR